MNRLRGKRAELHYVQNCATAWLRERGFSLIIENEWRNDGWRGEFIGKVDEEEVVLLCHKPLHGPYLTLCLVVTTGEPAALGDALRLMDCASDFDAAAWYPEANRGQVHISSRLLLSGMNPADFDFTLNNLFCCREALLEGREGERET